MTRPAELLLAVEEVARLAGDTALSMYSPEIGVERKGDGSPVTIADREAERRAREWIERRFPAHGILGEELGTVRPDAEYRWILDPIDGTQSFIRGVPLWGSLVAVARGEEVIAGAINCAAAKELVCAAMGEGCWWNGSREAAGAKAAERARARVSNVTSLAEATVLTTDVRFTGPRAEGWSELARGARVARAWGDCYGYLLVATGRVEVMADPVMSPWDAAALLPVVLEAGGVITDWSGRTTAFGGSIVACNAALAPEVQRILRVGREDA